MSKAKLNEMPQLMDVICNIQAMRGKIDPGYDQFKDFKKLERLTDDELHSLQDQLIPEYNKVINQLKSNI